MRRRHRQVSGQRGGLHRDDFTTPDSRADALAHGAAAMVGSGRCYVIYMTLVLYEYFAGVSTRVRSGDRLANRRTSKVYASRLPQTTVTMIIRAGESIHKYILIYATHHC